MVVHDASGGRGVGEGPIKRSYGTARTGDGHRAGTRGRRPVPPVHRGRRPAPAHNRQPRRSGPGGAPRGPQRRAGGPVDARSLSGVVGVVCYAFETVPRSSSCPWWSCFPSRSAGSSVPGSAARLASVAPSTTCRIRHHPGRGLIQRIRSPTIPVRFSTTLTSTIWVFSFLGLPL